MGRRRVYADEATRKREWERRQPPNVCACGALINFKSSRCRRCAAASAPRENGKFVTKS